MLEKEIQEKNGEIRELSQKLSDMERDKHTEIVKLRLEVSSAINPPPPPHTQGTFIFKLEKIRGLIIGA